MEDHLLKIVNRNKNQISKALKNDEITDILNSKEFYLNSAVNSYHEFLNLEVPINTQSIFRKKNGEKIKLSFYEGAIEKVKKFYASNGSKNYGDFLQSIGTSPDSEVLRKAAEVVAYSDFNAWNKNELNEYSDKRVIAKSFVRQNIWIISLLQFKKDRDYSNLKSSNIINALKFYEAPFASSTILSENHRTLICKNLLDLSYDPSNFEQTLDTFFKFYNELKLLNADNRQLFYARVLYSESFRSIWDKDFNKKSAEFLDSEEDINDSTDSKYSNDAEIIPDGIAQEDLLNRRALMEVIHKKVKVYWNDKSQK